MAKLGINGKVVDITNIAKKSKAQFKAQLKQAGVEIDDERLEKVYTTLHDQKPEKVKLTPEESFAKFKEPYPEQAAEIEKIKAAAQAKAKK